MNQQETIDFVIHQLSQYRNRDDIILDLCNQSGYSWDEIDDFVREVEYDYQKQISKRRRPLLLAMGVGAMVGGLILLTLATMDLVSIITMGDSSVDLYSLLWRLVYGFGMASGGIIGLWRIGHSWLQHK